ncbi:MAG: leucine-rich repeat protein, partial [Oscillospiraceae bacterium]|nr:leucine-rich repeat protein [Oscillospiraceae bacterium]
EYTIYKTENNEYYASVQSDMPYVGADTSNLLMLPESVWYDINGDGKAEAIPIKEVSLKNATWLILSDSNVITRLQTNSSFIYYESDFDASVIEELEKEHEEDENGYSNDENLMNVGKALKDYPHHCHIPEHLEIIDSETFKDENDSGKSYFAGTITIPESVTELGEGAFTDCGRLNNSFDHHYLSDGDLNFVINANISEIKANTFQGCGMSTVRFSPTITRIGENAFAGVIGGSYSYLGKIGIYSEVDGKKQREWQEISFEETFGDVSHITSIGQNAFANTPWLDREKELFTKEELQENPDDGVIYFGNGVLSYRDNFPENSEITFREGTTFIADYAFYGCRNLTALTIPDGVEIIPQNAFYGCRNLADVTIPDSVKIIEKEAFFAELGFGKLHSIDIPESVEEINEGAFGRQPLKEIYIRSKDCVIFDAVETLSGSRANIDQETQKYKNDSKTIYGYDNSTAQAYAEKYGYHFESLGTAPETTELLPGDADNSGSIDILDVITLNKAILGKEELSETQLKAIDFNGNGKPDSEESLKIMKYIVGLITSFTE